jgi:hypothetical protein
LLTLKRLSGSGPPTRLLKLVYRIRSAVDSTIDSTADSFTLRAALASPHIPPCATASIHASTRAGFGILSLNACGIVANFAPATVSIR